jgi:hypothetical protein
LRKQLPSKPWCKPSSAPAKLEVAAATGARLRTAGWAVGQHAISLGGIGQYLPDRGNGVAAGKVSDFMS